MESAWDKHTGRIVDAAELWTMDPVDPFGFECPGCNAQASPCSYRPENKVRPHFRANYGHEKYCDVEGEIELLKRAKKQPVSTREGFPGRFPNRLVLRDTRTLETSDSPSTISTSSSQRRRISTNTTSETRQRRLWAAQTIRPISRTFLDFPYDRHLPLNISGIAADTYQRVFQSLSRSEIIRYHEPRLFYAPISWKPPTADDDAMEVQLNFGEWHERKLIRPYRLIVHWKNWGASKRRYVSLEIETTRSDCIMNNTPSNRMKGWLFFIGRQDQNDPSCFHIEDHRLICCVFAEMIYPSRPITPQR